MIWLLVIIGITILFFTIKYFLDIDASVNGEEMKRSRKKGQQQVEDIKNRVSETSSNSDWE